MSDPLWVYCLISLAIGFFLMAFIWVCVAGADRDDPQ